MNLLENIIQIFRPKLPVKQDILEREKEFNKSNPSKESWILNHTYLCEGNLEALKQHPDFDTGAKNIDHVISYYESPQGKKGPCKKITIKIPLRSDEQITIKQLEKELKLCLHNRGCNAGVFYKRYKKDNFLYAEAVPATISLDF